MTTISITLPIFAVIACGYFAVRRNIIDSSGRAGLNNFVFYFALPVLTFSLMSQADLRGEFQWTFVLAYASVGLILFFASIVIARRIFRLNQSMSTVFATASIYGNTGYFGVPFVVIAFGQQASVPMVVCTTIDLAIMLPLASVLLDRARSSESGKFTEVVSGALASVVKNPLIIAAALGAAVSLSQIELPQIADRFIILLGSAAAPCALFALGASMNEQRAAFVQGELYVISLIKLAVHPFLMWLAMFHFFAVDLSWGQIAIIAAAMPVAVTAYVLAQQFNVYVGRTSASILLSTAASIATLSFVLNHVS